MVCDLARMKPEPFRQFVGGIVSRFSNAEIGPKLEPAIISTILVNEYGFLEDQLVHTDFHINGKLNLSHQEIHEAKSVQCGITMQLRWLSRMPVVHVAKDALWEDGKEWHCNKKSGEICYAYSCDWVKAVRQFLNKFGCHGFYLSGIHLADLICSLMYRHLEARRSRMKNWPIEWEYRPHSAPEAHTAFKKENPKYVEPNSRELVDILK